MVNENMQRKVGPHEELACQFGQGPFHQRIARTVDTHDVKLAVDHEEIHGLDERVKWLEEKVRDHQGYIDAKGMVNPGNLELALREQHVQFDALEAQVRELKERVEALTAEALAETICNAIGEAAEEPEGGDSTGEACDRDPRPAVAPGGAQGGALPEHETLRRSGLHIGEQALHIVALEQQVRVLRKARDAARQAWAMSAGECAKANYRIKELEAQTASPAEPDGPRGAEPAPTETLFGWTITHEPGKPTVPWVAVKPEKGRITAPSRDAIVAEIGRREGLRPLDEPASTEAPTDEARDAIEGTLGIGRHAPTEARSAEAFEGALAVLAMRLNHPDSSRELGTDESFFDDIRAHVAAKDAEITTLKARVKDFEDLLTIEIARRTDTR